jgi:hypothetical protein
MGDDWGLGCLLGMGLGMPVFSVLIVSAVVMLMRGRTSPDEISSSTVDCGRLSV